MRNRVLAAALASSMAMAIAHADPATAAPINLALSGTATQSSTGFGGDASRAIDGDTNGSYFANSVTHTDIQQGAFWRVDLGGVFDLENIVLWNRTDCCSDRLSNFEVSVLDGSLAQVFSQDFFTNGGTFNPSLDIDLPSDTSGRYVQVMLNGTNYLSLAEVQVFQVEQDQPIPNPEPAALGLLGTGLLGLVWSQKRRRAARSA